MKNNKQGFTLIELSIVLVIIGLIVGGVLVGQDLIKGAEIRATVSQVEKFNAAVNTFRGKYNGLPGDLGTAANFGLEATNLAGGTGTGNGNGLIESSGTTGVVGLMGETKIFWTHLAQANLIGDPITSTNYTNAAGGVIAAIGDANLPLAKMGKGNRFHVATSGGLNYFALAGFTGATVVTTAAFGTAPVDNITPQEAFQVDSKLDDGLANSGTVRAITIAAGATSLAAAGEAGATDAGNGAPAAGNCWDSDDGNYGTASATARDANGCQLRVRTSF